MNEQFYDQGINIYTDIGNYEPDIPKTEGQIEVEYVKAKKVDEMPTREPDVYEVSKLDYVNPEYLDPVNMYMNWNKKHPEGQWGPMKSENKMVSYERKNKNSSNTIKDVK